MSTFVLPQHANKETLKGLFQGFRTRIESSGRIDVLLGGMRDALSNRSSHCLIYWPLKNDEWHTKTCVYDQTFERGKESAVCFHLVYLTTLLAKLNKTATRFLECQCHNHTRDIHFDWQEFVYPQFVELLSKRTVVTSDERSISAPPTPPSPISLSRERSNPVRIPSPCYDECERAHHIELRAYQNRDKDLAQFVVDAFALPSAALVDRYHKESALAQFGVDTIQEMQYFRQRRVTRDEYKLFFTLEDVKVRAPFLSGGAIELKACTDDMPPYVVLCSNFTLRMPTQGGHKVYHVYLPERIARPRELVDQDFGVKRRVDCRDLCVDSRLCMIISRAPLRIEFKGTASLMLVTRGACKFDLESAILEMWAPMKTTWPCVYEVVSAKRVTPHDRQYFFERLHATYHDLFAQNQYALCRPCIGHVTFEQASMFDMTIRTTPGFINQYGTMLPLPPPSEIISRSNYTSIDLVGLRVQFPLYNTQGEGGAAAAMPLFYTRDGMPLLLVEQMYEFAGQRYILHGLCAKKGDPVACYFKLSARRDYLLFIPVF